MIFLSSCVVFDPNYEKKKCFLRKRVEIGTPTPDPALSSRTPSPSRVTPASSLSCRPDRGGGVRFSEAERRHQTHALPGQPSVTSGLPAGDEAAGLPPVPRLHRLPAGQCPSAASRPPALETKSQPFSSVSPARSSTPRFRFFRRKVYFSGRTRPSLSLRSANPMMRCRWCLRLPFCFVHFSSE